MKKLLIFAVVAMAVLALVALAFSLDNLGLSIEIGGRREQAEEPIDFRSLYAQPLAPDSFVIPPLDLRGYDLDHDAAGQWFLERLNYHRESYGIHPYELYPAAVVTSIEHSLDMRDNAFSRNAASDGRVHQERHHRWFGFNRTKVTSAHSSTHNVAPGPLTQAGAYAVIDTIVSNRNSRPFLMNPTYYYIGFGFSIDANGRGRLSITMASPEGERAAHRARSLDEREVHRQEYLERVRQERGWTEPS